MIRPGPVPWAAAALLLTVHLTAGARADTTVGCPTFSDPAGDAYKQADFGVGVNVPSDPDMDLTGVTLQSPAGKLRVTFTVLALGAPAYGVGHIYSLSFPLRGKPLRIFGGQDVPQPAEALHAVPGVNRLSGVTYDSIPLDTTPDVVFDPARSLVVVTVDRAPIEVTAKTSLADGTVLNKLEAATDYDLFQTTQTVDTAATSSTTYTMGDNTCQVTTTPSASATPPSDRRLPYSLPRAGCVAFKDADGDATPSPMGNDPDLDLLDVNLKTDGGTVATYIHVAALSASPASPFDGHEFGVAFTANGKRVSLAVQRPGAGSATLAGEASSELAPTATFDTAHSYVVLSLPLAALAKNTGVGDGSVVTDVVARSAAEISLTGQTFPADDASGATAEETRYTIGDNRCFLPPPGVIDLDVAPQGQYSDRVEVRALLSDASAAPVANARLTLRLGPGTPLNVVTDTGGMARALVPLTLPAGATSLTASFAGDYTVGVTSRTVPITVLLERTMLRARGSRGTVTATLADDDKHRVGGVTVVFRVGSKSRFVKTDSKGVAKVGRLKRGTTVTVVFTGQTGRFSAAKKVSAKAQ